ncbi:MAG: glutathione S-transferase family protein [Pseudomonadota bacterium]
MKLYTVPTANGQRASIALEECGLDYEVRPIDFRKGEHRSDEVLALNPLGRLPILAEASSGLVVYGSMAIARWAAAASGRLQPPPDQAAAMEHWAGIVMTDLSPAFASQFHLGVLAPEPHQWALDYYAEVIHRVLGVIDTHLTDREYFLGDSYSLADVLMYPSATSSTARLEGGLEPYPALMRWRDQVGARPAVIAGMAASGSLF